MKKIIIILALAGCSPVKNSQVDPGAIQLRIVSVSNSTGKVIARNSFRWYMARFDSIPDSITVGKILTVYAIPPGGKDTCKYLFKQIFSR